MRALGNPSVPVKVWKECGLFRNHKRNTREALANFKRGDKKRARREGRAEALTQLAEARNELPDMNIEELRALAASLPALPADLAAELHYRLWSWVVDHAHERPLKSDWPGWDCGTHNQFGGHRIFQECFLCTGQFYIHGEFGRTCCEDCPMNRMAIRHGIQYCAPYQNWNWANIVDSNVARAAFWASRIRDCVKRG